MVKFPALDRQSVAPVEQVFLNILCRDEKKTGVPGEKSSMHKVMDQSQEIQLTDSAEKT